MFAFFDDKTIGEIAAIFLNIVATLGTHGIYGKPPERQGL
jgi:hypothetical protein